MPEFDDIIGVQMARQSSKYTVKELSKLICMLERLRIPS
jgi:hypothetical protein